MTAYWCSTLSFLRYSETLVENRKYFLPHVLLAPRWSAAIGTPRRSLVCKIINNVSGLPAAVIVSRCVQSFIRSFIHLYICIKMVDKPNVIQELIRRWDSERELLRSAPGSYPNSLKKRKVMPLRRSRSFKVTDFGTNRQLIYDFLLVINSNLPPILHRFRDIAVDRSEIAIFYYPSCV